MSAIVRPGEGTPNPGAGMKIEEAARSIGRSVIYDDGYGTRETGVITSVNDVNVFVRYGARPNSQATSPEDLRFEIGGPSPLLRVKAEEEK
jgi:hypothetical protein